jgi:prophage DNA circulation protein
VVCHARCRQQLAAEADRTEAAAVAAAEADVVWQEVLMQTEEDLEKRAQTDSERLAALQRTAEEVGKSCTTAALSPGYGH